MKLNKTTYVSGIRDIPPILISYVLDNLFTMNYDQNIVIYKVNQYKLSSYIVHKTNNFIEKNFISISV